MVFAFCCFQGFSQEKCQRYIDGHIAHSLIELPTNHSLISFVILLMYSLPLDPRYARTQTLHSMISYLDLLRFQEYFSTKNVVQLALDHHCC